MEVKYIKEQQKSYAVIKSTEEEIKVTYQKKMLENGGLKTIVNECDRIIDGDTYNYYDISSKISLSQLYGSRKLVMTDINQIITSMGKCCEEVDRYLLDISRVWLDPDFIFYNYSSLKYSFLYNVSAETTEIVKDRDKLLDYLLEHVSPDDKVATDYVYQIYEFYEKGNLDIWDMISMLPTDVEKENSDEEKQTGIEFEKLLYKEESSLGGSDYTDVSLGDNSQYQLNSNFGMEYEKENAIGIAPFVLMILGIIGEVLCGTIVYIMELEQGEIVAIIAGACSCGVLLITGILLLIRGIAKNSKKKKDDEALKDYIEEELTSLSPKSDNGIHVSDILVFPSHSEPQSSVKTKPQTEIDDEGKTVLFEPGGEGGTYKLFALDRKNKQHITLDRFPYTIGKMAGYVDCYLEHPSISRLHARIENEEGQISIRDLNSTNGVYLNGMKMSPNEKRLLEVGDEIKLGGLTYCLRFC